MYIHELILFVLLRESTLSKNEKKEMKADKTWADWGIVMSVFVSRGDSQRVLYRPVNHMTAGSITTRFQLVQSHNCSSKIQSFFDTVTSNISYCRVRLKGHTYSWVTYASTAEDFTAFKFPSLVSEQTFLYS